MQIESTTTILIDSLCVFPSLSFYLLQQSTFFVLFCTLTKKLINVFAAAAASIFIVVAVVADCCSHCHQCKVFFSFQMQTTKLYAAGVL